MDLFLPLNLRDSFGSINGWRKNFLYPGGTTEERERAVQSIIDSKYGTGVEGPIRDGVVKQIMLLAASQQATDNAKKYILYAGSVSKVRRGTGLRLFGRVLQ